MPDPPQPIETLHEVLLLCELCDAKVSITAANTHPWTNAWLDGKITMRCPAHLARRRDGH